MPNDLRGLAAHSPAGAAEKLSTSLVAATAKRARDATRYSRRRSFSTSSNRSLKGRHSCSCAPTRCFLRGVAACCAGGADSFVPHSERRPDRSRPAQQKRVKSPAARLAGSRSTSTAPNSTQIRIRRGTATSTRRSSRMAWHVLKAVASNKGAPRPRLRSPSTCRTSAPTCRRRSRFSLRSLEQRFPVTCRHAPPRRPTAMASSRCSGSWTGRSSIRSYSRPTTRATSTPGNSPMACTPLRSWRPTTWVAWARRR